MIELILASVRQAAEGPLLSGRGAGKKVRLPFESLIYILSLDGADLTADFIVICFLTD